MASKAHGFYCFEVLAASYKQQEHPDLQLIIDLYDQWQKEQAGESAQQTTDEAASDDNERTERQQGDSGRTQLPIPSISRLRELTPSSHSSISTPSSVSVNSSNTQLTSTTSVDDTAPSYASRLAVTESYPMFVTWNTLSRSGHKSLRGWP